MNSPEAVNVLVELEKTAIEEWDDPGDFQMMLSDAASDAGMSDELLGKVGKRVEAANSNTE